MKRLFFHVMPIMILIGLIGALPAAGRVLIIPIDAPTIQAGIDLAEPGDILEIACGTYQEHNIHLKSGVSLRNSTGEFGGVVIDAGGMPGGIFAQNITHEMSITGLTIRNVVAGQHGALQLEIAGGNVQVRECLFADSWSVVTGAGISVQGLSGNLLVENCGFQNNDAITGGGLHLCAAPAFTATVSHCKFMANGNGCERGGGIAVNMLGGEVTVSYCRFHQNGAVMGAGIAINGVAGVLRVEYSDFLDNMALCGAGIDLVGAAGFEPVIESCAFRHNCFCDGDAPFGGALCLQGSLRLENCSITDNGGGGSGGGVFVRGQARFTAVNTDILCNTSGGCAGIDGYVSVLAEATLICCDVDLEKWDGPGSIVIDNDDCAVATETTTWSELKSLYR